MKRLAFLAVFCASALVRAQEDPYAFDVFGSSFEIEQELLDDAVAEARPLVEEALGYAIPDDFGGVRVAEVAEIERFLVAENLPILRSQLSDDEAAREQAEAFGASMAGALLAKYSFDTREILISPKGFEATSSLLELPELLDPAVVRAAVVHELVHAADVPEHDFLARIVATGDPDRILALNCVLEGHAQFVMRGVCQELGLEEASAVYDRAILGVPRNEGDQGEGVRFLRSMLRRNVAIWYSAGERFVAAVYEREGRAGVRRAFREGPRDLAEIHRPEWFLDPASRPEAIADLERGLDAFAAGYEDRKKEQKWTEARQTLNAQQLRVAFESLGEQRAAAIADALVAGRILQYTAPGSSASHYALVMEWRSSDAAAQALAASEELVRLRDETMKEGAVRILEAEYEPATAAGPGVFGLLARKKMSVYGQPLDVHTLLLRSGSVSVELLRSGQVGEAGELLATGVRILAAARAEPAGDEQPVEGESPAGEPEPVGVGDEG